MNHFELYNIPVSLQPDAQLVKQKFYELSRKYHPDFFTNAAETEQAAVLETSSQVNKAYKIFRNPGETIKYVLQLHGLLEEEEKYQLPGSFLAEMLDLNEQLMEAELDGNAAGKANLQQSVKEMEASVYAPVKDIIEHYEEGTTTEQELLQVKDYYYKKKYLSRILAGMQ